MLAYHGDATDYAQIELALPRIERPTILVAESFSGPLAIRLAARTTQVRGLLMVASFARAPRLARLSAALPRALLRAGLALPAPRWAVESAMLAGADTELVSLAASTIASVPADTRARRLAAVAGVDDRETLASLRIPVLWARATRDRLVERAHADEARTLGASVEVRDVEGPHLLAQAQPADIAALVAELMARVRA